VKIGILGAGNIGGTLGQQWAAAGHEIMFGARDVNSAKVQKLIESISGVASAGSVAEAIEFGDLVLFAIPFVTVGPTVDTYAESLAGKMIIDATNNFGAPVINNLAALSRVRTSTIFRAFNSLGWEMFAEPVIGGQQVDLFYCGPAGERRETMENLIKDVGLRPVWVGDLEQAALVDNIGSLWGQLAFRQGMGRRLAFKVLLPDG
jgi:predicted dinucleotide-binding enzyme